MSIEAAEQYINTIDFSKIIYKLTNYEGWLEKDALETCKQYKRFLLLNKKYLHAYGQLPPSEDIDDFWHSHILDTETYTRDCLAIYGRYIHHYPYFGIGIDGTHESDLNSAFEKTKELYFKEYGEHLFATRSYYPSYIYAALLLIQKIRKRFTRKTVFQTA